MILTDTGFNIPVGQWTGMQGIIDILATYDMMS
jgi:hypothetical protein